MSDTKPKKICGAKLRKKDAICHSTILYVNGRCKLHGGASPSGMGSSTYKHGMRSKYSTHLPPRLLKNYKRAVTDPHLLSLDGEIAVLDSRIVEMLELLKTGGGPDLWLSLEKAFLKFQEAQAQGNAVEAAQALQDIAGSVQKGIDEAKAWEHILVAFESRRKLVESERKYRIEQGMATTIESTMAIVRAILGSVREAVFETIPDANYQRAVIRKVASTVPALLAREGLGAGQPTAAIEHSG